MEKQSFRLVSLTWPIFLELLLFMLMGSVDTFMLSRVSDDAVSAVGAANQIVSVAILILEVIGNGAAIVIAQYLGSRMLYEASRISATAVALNALVGLALSLLFLLGGGAMLRAMNLHGDILAHAETYLAIVGGGIFLQALINIAAAIVRTHGFTKETMLVSLGMNVVHVIGNYLLIFGHWGLPELGVKGAAISTVASRLLCMAVFFWLMYRVMEVRIQAAHYVKLSVTHIRGILRIGIPSAFEQILYHSCQLVFFFYATFLGAEALASRQYASNISTYVYLFSAAVGMGTAIITGRLVGARRTDEAYGRVWVSVKWAMIATVAIDLIVIAFRKPLLGLFTDNPDIIRLGAQVIVLGLLLETGRTCNLVVINSLRAAGDAKFPVYIGLISMVGISLPLGYLLVFRLDMGLAGIWLAIAADEWIRSIVMVFRWRSRAWERYGLVPVREREGPPEPPAVTAG
ncbi:MATE family efflux transporter [Paenibacillus flagellatus]|uniref:MATE family efflux transporter n=1 Tax=Paenibacillus flagellatus TaxID=2211139 RepID=A0A2V5K121_9BACL|nr:MATE family efflux transporter [Paenibacillus flagellatus]PYI52895.1 MATE family efflux transporter [Paenibacillus flagellatus]